jgi:hypothetical protein
MKLATLIFYAKTAKYFPGFLESQNINEANLINPDFSTKRMK